MNHAPDAWSIARPVGENDDDYGGGGGDNAIAVIVILLLLLYDHHHHHYLKSSQKIIRSTAWLFQVQPQGIHDNTGLNAVELNCRVPESDLEAATVVSHSGHFGGWTSYTMCREDYYLVAFKLRVAPFVGTGERGEMKVA